MSDDNQDLSSSTYAGIYIDFASKAELIDQLNRFLAAERARTKVATRSRTGRLPPRIEAFFGQLSRDQAKCCSMLARHITDLGGAVTAEVGAFYQSAMEISDIHLRLAFINRGRGWVVHRLRDLLLRVRAGNLRSDLQDMLHMHERNIEATNRLVSASAYSHPF